MLTLQPDWASIMGGAVATNLVRQLDSMSLRDEVAHHLTGAALDLLVSTWPRGDRSPLRLETISQSVWNILDVHYIYLRANDDGLLGTCIKLSRVKVVTVIMPRHYEKLKRRLLTATLRHRTPNIWSFDAFISWRTTTAAIDQAWPSERAVLELLNAYNRRINAMGSSDSMLVQLPHELA